MRSRKVVTCNSLTIVFNHLLSSISWLLLWSCAIEPKQNFTVIILTLFLCDSIDAIVPITYSSYWKNQLSFDMHQINWLNDQALRWLVGFLEIRNLGLLFETFHSLIFHKLVAARPVINCSECVLIILESYFTCCCCHTPMLTVTMLIHWCLAGVMFTMHVVHHLSSVF